MMIAKTADINTTQSCIDEDDVCVGTAVRVLCAARTLAIAIAKRQLVCTSTVRLGEKDLVIVETSLLFWRSGMGGGWSN